MTLLDEAAAAVQHVRLTPGEWRKASVVLLLLFVCASYAAVNVTKWTLIEDRKRVVDRIDVTEKRLAADEIRIEKMEQALGDLRVIRNDVDWIRLQMASKQKDRRMTGE